VTCCWGGHQERARNRGFRYRAFGAVRMHDANGSRLFLKVKVAPVQMIQKRGGEGNQSTYQRNLAGKPTSGSIGWKFRTGSSPAWAHCAAGARVITGERSIEGAPFKRCDEGRAKPKVGTGGDTPGDGRVRAKSVTGSLQNLGRKRVHSILPGFRSGNGSGDTVNISRRKRMTNCDGGRIYHPPPPPPPPPPLLVPCPPCWP